MRELPAHDLDWSNDSELPFEAASLLDRHSEFEGTFRSQRDVRVEGNLKGTFTCDGTLFIAEGASEDAPDSPAPNKSLKSCSRVLPPVSRSF